VQLASHAGATVIATASGDDEAYLHSLGASRVLDYRKTQFEAVLQEKVDMVLDLVGGDTQKRSFLVLEEGGHLISATQPVSQEEAAKHRVSGAMMRLAPSGEVLGGIARLLGLLLCTAAKRASHLQGDLSSNVRIPRDRRQNAADERHWGRDSNLRASSQMQGSPGLWGQRQQRLTSRCSVSGLQI
jgi:NADPH-dependent curcumin reductase CurA